MPTHSSCRQTEMPKDERLAERVVVDLAIDATLRGRACRLLVFDLSTSGCKAEATNNLFAVDDAVIFNLPGGHPAAGRVVWALETCAGIVFDNPLHEAVVAHLGFKPAGEPLHFRDRFGRPLPARFRRGDPI